jgi:hypothetical protein
MDRICSFADYVLLKEGSRTSSSKTGLYPLGYGGIGLYPLADYLTHAADAILYLTQDKRLYHNGDGPPFPITHLPGPTPPENPNSGEGPPFDIRHLYGKKPHKNFNNVGEGPPFSIKNLK